MQCFSTHGLPETLVTDNAMTFSSDEFKQFTTYHAASIGLAERAVQTVKQGLKKMNGGSLASKLYRFLARYRITPHSTTQTSPAELLLKRNPRNGIMINTQLIVILRFRIPYLLWIFLAGQSGFREWLKTNQVPYLIRYSFMMAVWSAVIKIILLVVIVLYQMMVTTFQTFHLKPVNINIRLWLNLLFLLPSRWRIQQVIHRYSARLTCTQLNSSGTASSQKIHPSV